MGNERPIAGSIDSKVFIMTMNSSFLSRLRTTYDNRNEPEYARAFADLFWRTSLVLAATVVALTIASGTGLFFQALAEVNSLQTRSATPPPTSGTQIDRKALDATVVSLVARTTSFQNLQSSIPDAVADPSQ